MSAPALTRSSRLDSLLRDVVDRGVLPQVVAVAADEGGVIYEAAAGPRVAGEREPVGPDSTFRIASMTKIICTVAALQQRDRGILDVDAPVEAYCPDFADLQVLDGFDAGQPRLRPPASRATVRQLLSHTAGLAYSFWNADIVRWAASPEAAAESGRSGLFAAPLVADPGSEVTYGIATDWLGRVLEAAGGQALDVCLSDHVLGPLEMTSTTFRPDDPQRARTVPVHDRAQDGAWAPTGIDWDPAPEFWPGGHGLYSTPSDFLRFQRMLLGGGSLDGRRILDESSVREMFDNQIGDLWFPAAMQTTDPGMTLDFRVGPGMRWGWGLLLNTEAQPNRRAAGSGGWAGIFNTYFWVDPRSRLTGAFFTQCRPFQDPGVLQSYADFEHAVYVQNA